ncbi:MAG: 50S ribosomal protein L32 [Oligoflexia bacterium]|nr:50S ribosomal protein L32 [Oligoflexia bacterium]
MPVPKKRTTKSRRNMRRSHDALERTFAVVCPNCGEPVLRHRICLACGQYRGKQIIAVSKEETSAAS